MLLMHYMDFNLIVIENIQNTRSFENFQNNLALENLKFLIYIMGKVLLNLLNEIEKGNGECVQSENNPTIEQTTAEGHQWVFTVVRNSRTRRRPSAGPLKNMYTSTVNYISSEKVSKDPSVIQISCVLSYSFSNIFII